MSKLTTTQTKPTHKPTTRLTVNASSFDAVLSGKGTKWQDACLLLDTSYSMEGESMKELRRLAEEFPDTTKICFDSSVTVLAPGQLIPNVGGTTALHKGIAIVHQEGFPTAVLITDGHPDSPRLALDAVKQTGVKLEIIYVGKGAPPQFLSDLAKASGGGFCTGDLHETALLADKVAGLLGEGTEPKKETIIL